MNWDAEKPYDDLPLIPPNKDLETREILKLSAEARVELEAFRTSTELLFEDNLLLDNLSNIEALASCAIEGICVSPQALREYLNHGGEENSDAEKVVRNKSAILRSKDLLLRTPISLNSAKKVCTILRGIETDVRKVPGVHIANPATGKVIYTSPSNFDAMYEKISNWENFVNCNVELDPLVALAIAHYQFEAIHPFEDGNGRTGRVLNLMFLLQRKLLDLPLLLLSDYILDNRESYYKLLIRVTKNEERIPWIRFMLKAIKDSSTYSRAYSLELISLKNKRFTMINVPRLQK